VHVFHPCSASGIAISRKVTVWRRIGRRTHRKTGGAKNIPRAGKQFDTARYALRNIVVPLLEEWYCPEPGRHCDAERFAARRIPGVEHTEHPVVSFATTPPSLSVDLLHHDQQPRRWLDGLSGARRTLPAASTPVGTFAPLLCSLAGRYPRGSEDDGAI